MILKLYEALCIIGQIFDGLCLYTSVNHALGSFSVQIPLIFSENMVNMFSSAQTYFCLCEVVTNDMLKYKERHQMYFYYFMLFTLGLAHLLIIFYLSANHLKKHMT